MSGDTPVGTVCMWAGNRASLDSDWMICEGGTLEISKFPQLFKIIRNSFGAGPPAGKFYLPDLRGYFVRGVDSGSDHDPDANDRVDPVTRILVGDSVGSFQEDALQDHKHNYEQFPNGRGDIASGRHWKVAPAVSGGVTGARSSTETRPKNIALHYIIKVK